MIRLAALLCFMLPVAAFAKPPSGTNLTGPEHAWWECQHQTNGISCCSIADGHTLKDEDWRQDPVHLNQYQVRVDGTWFDVPPTAVIQPIHQCGPEPDATKRSMAKAWFAPYRDETGKIVNLTIYCFMSGTMY